MSQSIENRNYSSKNPPISRQCSRHKTPLTLKTMQYTSLPKVEDLCCRNEFTDHRIGGQVLLFLQPVLIKFSSPEPMGLFERKRCHSPRPIVRSGMFSPDSVSRGHTSPWNDAPLYIIWHVIEWNFKWHCVCYTPRNELRCISCIRVCIMFLTHPSVGQSVSSSVLFFCQSISPIFFVSAAPQNLVKFYSYEVQEASASLYTAQH